MSPEQARGRALDKRTDIWSFGIMLFECLTGVRLFQGETANDSMGAILHKEPDWSSLPSSTPPTIQLLLRRCLTKDRKRRLHDIADARIELENAIADPTSSSLGLATSALVSQGVQNRPSISRAVLGLAVILASVLGGLVGRQLVNEPDSSVRKYELPLHDQGFGNVGQPAISPDGKMVAFVDRDRLWIRHLDSWDTRAVEESDRGIIPFWSPDSKWLAFGRGDELVKVRASGGRPTFITKTPGILSFVGCGAWSTDGRIFFSTGDTGILVVSAEGGVAEVYVPDDLPEDDDFHELTLLPDNKTVVFTVHSREEVWHLDSFDGRERKRVFSFDDHYAVAPAYSRSGHILVQRMGAHSSVWAIPFDAGRLETTGAPFLVADGDGDPTVSNTGTLVLTKSIVGYLSGELVKFDLASNEMEPVASPGGVFSDHALSPDGKSLVLSGFDLDSLDIWILHVETGSRMRLTFDDATNELLPRWSPDGSVIAFAKTTATAFERIGKNDTIHFFSVDGSGETRAPIEGAYPSFDAEWNYVTFVRTNESTRRDIYFMPMDGSVEPQALLDQPYVEEHPALSPDGQWLAYTSNESGVQTIFLTRFPSGEGKWQVSGPGGVFPRWSPDGTRIYFAGADVGISEVRVTTKPRVMLSKPRMVVDGLKRGIDPFLGFDFTDGGKSLIVVKQRGGDRPATIGVIENWYEEFRVRR